jgi:prevent-host-death family protein
MTSTITIKELHAATGETMRRAGASRTPLVVTDRGTPVAAIVNLASIAPARPRKRVLLPEYAAMIANAKIPRTSTLQEDLDAIRGER